MAAGAAAQEAAPVVTERTRLLVDSRYDAAPDSAMAAFMAPYAKVVDSIMSQVVGRTAMPLAAYRPESPLSNLLADILLDAGAGYGESPQLAVYNMGGIRASLPGGDVTYGNVLEVAPFENKICFLTLTGESLPVFKQPGDAVLTATICARAARQERASKAAVNSLFIFFLFLLLC